MATLDLEFPLYVLQRLDGPHWRTVTIDNDGREHLAVFTKPERASAMKSPDWMIVGMGATQLESLLVHGLPHCQSVAIDPLADNPRIEWAPRDALLEGLRRLGSCQGSGRQGGGC